SSEMLPLIAWDESDRAFYVSELPARASGVKKQFTLPFVYYAGSHEGCGCGFLKGGRSDEEMEKVKENYAKLAEYVSQARRKRIAVELFSCWAGDEEAAPEFREVINGMALKQEDFEFKEKAFYRFAES
ncbi:MAG TPA: hypothetical protein VID27_04565, partial [Blastocatellia bacterium]